MVQWVKNLTAAAGVTAEVCYNSDLTPSPGTSICHLGAFFFFVSLFLSIYIFDSQ